MHFPRRHINYAHLEEKPKLAHFGVQEHIHNHVGVCFERCGNKTEINNHQSSNIYKYGPKYGYVQLVNHTRAKDLFSWNYMQNFLDMISQTLVISNTYIRIFKSTRTTQNLVPRLKSCLTTWRGHAASHMNSERDCYLTNWKTLLSWGI